MFKFRANICFIFRICKLLAIKSPYFSLFLFENRDFVFELREITDFKHKII